MKLFSDYVALNAEYYRVKRDRLVFCKSALKEFMRNQEFVKSKSEYFVCRIKDEYTNDFRFNFLDMDGIFCISEIRMYGEDICLVDNDRKTEIYWALFCDNDTITDMLMDYVVFSKDVQP